MMGLGDEEQVYYQFLAFVRMVENLQGQFNNEEQNNEDNYDPYYNEDDSQGPGIEIIFQLIDMYQGLKALGLDTATMANYAMTIFEQYLLPNIPNIYDDSDLQIQKSEKEGFITNDETEMTNIEQDVNTEIAQLEANNPGDTTGTLAQDAADYWQTIMDYNIADAEWQFATENAQYNKDFDGWTLEELTNLYDEGKMDEVQMKINGMDYEIGMMYSDLITLYDNKVNAETLWLDTETYFNNTHPGVIISDDQEFFYYANDKGYDYFNAYYDKLHYQMELQQIIDEINHLAEIKPTWQVIEAFFAVPQNLTDTEHMLTLLLDEFDNMVTNPNFGMLMPLINQLQFGQIFSMSQDEISANLIGLSSIFGGMFDTWNADDITFIKTFITTFADAYIDGTNTVDPADMKTAFSEMITDYFDLAIQAPEALSQFLATMDAAKVKDAFYEVNMMMMGGMGMNGMAFAGTVSQLIDALVGDGSMDYTAIVTPVFGIVYDMKFMMGYTDPDSETTVDKINNMITLINNIVTDADLLANFDPNDVTFDYISNAIEFSGYLQQFNEFMDDLMAEVSN